MIQLQPMNKILPICLIIISVVLVTIIFVISYIDIQQDEWHQTADYWFKNYNLSEENRERTVDLVSGNIYGITTNYPEEGKATTTLIYIKNGCTLIKYPEFSVNYDDWKQSITLLNNPIVDGIGALGDNVYTTKCK